MKKKKLLLSILLMSSVFMIGSLASCDETNVVSTGPQFYQGPGIPNDDLGNNGDTYKDTLTNDVYEKINGHWVLVTNGNPAQLSGNGEPSDELGENGDFYTDNTTNAYYYKQDGHWVKVRDGITTYTVMFDLNGGALPNGDTTIPSQTVEKGSWASQPTINPVKEHSTFLGWYPQGSNQAWVFTDAVHGDLVLVAQYKVNEEMKITITVDPNNGESTYTIDTFAGDTLRLSIPTLAGHSFIGWYIKGTDERVLSIATEDLNGKTIEARFEKSKFDFLYQVENNNEVTITGLRNIEAVNVVIPSTVNGMTVTKIKDTAFQSRIYIQSITLPATVKEVSGKAFAGAYRIQQVIVDGTSPYYEAVDNVLYTKGRTELVYCPAKYKDPGYSFTVPATVKKINEYAFYSHKDSGLSSITFNEGLEEIGRYAFAFNELMSSIKFPSTLKRICDHAFWGSASFSDDSGYVSPQGLLTQVEFNEGLEEIGDSAFVNQYFKDTFTLPSTVKKIGAYAFANCTAITKFIVPSGLQELAGSAFNGATGILEVDVAAGNEYFAATDNILYNKQMTKVVMCPSGRMDPVIIPNGVTEIGDYAFYMVDRCNDYTFPSTLKRIGNEAFAQTYELRNFVIPDSVTELGEGCFYASGLTSVTFGSGLTSIPVDAFQSTGLTSLNIPGNIKTIEEGAFWLCSRLTSVTFAEGLEEIGDLVFTSALTGNGTFDLILPNSLKSIGYMAFADSTNIKSVSIGSGLETIGNEVFTDATNISTITVSPNNNAFMAEDGILYSKNKEKLYFCVSGHGENLIIPEGVKEIGDFAFYNARGIKKATFPSSLEVIGVGAFCYTRIESVSFGSNLKEIKEGAFSYSYVTSATFSEGLEIFGPSSFFGADITALQIPDSVKVIGEQAFGSTNIGKLDLGEGVQEIGNEVFWNCRQLAGTIKLPASLRTLGTAVFATNTALITDFDCTGSENFSSTNGLLMDKLQKRVYAYANGNSATSLVVPATVTEILDRSMVNALNLVSLTLPSGLEYIGEEAFVNLKNVSRLVIPVTVTYVGPEAFSGMTANQYVCFECSEDYAMLTFAQYFDVGMATFVYSYVPVA